ncbi:MAG: Crp/Fnr family transcriptional regulator [Planctomycetota bacterium]|jgi:CRP/FNR family transcriptional regulator
MSIDKPKITVAPDVEQNLPCLGHLKKLLNCKTLRVIPPQHQIFSQGESPHTICLICNGLVKLTRTESDGNRAIVGLRKPGWLLGATAILPGLPYASTAETLIRSKLCFVPIEQFQQAMDTNTTFSKWVSMILCREVRSSTLSISSQSCLSGRQRLEKFLWEIIQLQNIRDTGKKVKIPIPLKQWELAQLLGLTPEHLSRLIKQMENKGIIGRERGWLIYRNPQKLSYSGRALRDFSESK